MQNLVSKIYNKEKSENVELGENSILEINFIPFRAFINDESNKKYIELYFQRH